MVTDAVIFDVQRFSIHDGPGIRTTVFFKGCPLRCAWCQNPEGLRREPELAFYADRCTSTDRCVAACDRGALRLGGDQIDRSSCDVCGACVEACPHGAFEVVGRAVTVDELIATVERDRPFYESSGGGVTLSGGEPTLQLDFVSAFVARCVEVGIPVGMQTSGAFGWEAVEPLLPMLQFVYFDLKAIDPDRHANITGVDNRAILANARRLHASDVDVVFRTPVVPGFNDGEADLDALAGFLSELGVRSVHLLRYHRMGEVKLPRLDSALSPLRLSDQARGVATFQRAVEYLGGRGLEVST